MEKKMGNEMETGIITSYIGVIIASNRTITSTISIVHYSSLSNLTSMLMDRAAPAAKVESWLVNPKTSTLHSVSVFVLGFRV